MDLLTIKDFDMNPMIKHKLYRDKKTALKKTKALYNNNRFNNLGVNVRMEKKEYWVYIAGPLSAAPIEYLGNVRRMLLAWKSLLTKGFTPICPAFDMLGIMMDYNENIDKDIIQTYSMELLKKCDVILLLDGWRDSAGAQAELTIAGANGIEVAIDLEQVEQRFRDKVINNA